MAKRKTKPPDVTFLRGYDLDLPRNDLAVLLTNTTVMRPERSGKSSRTKLGVVQQSLEGYHDLLAWMQQVDAIRPAAAKELLRQSREDRDEAARIFNHVLNLRSLFSRITGSLCAGKLPAKKDLEELGDAVEEVQPTPLRFSAAPGGGAWTWGRVEKGLGWPRRELVLSMAVLLSSDDRRHVRQCAGKDCTVVFVDNSRSRRRRWCSMGACGEPDRASRRAR